MWLVTFVPFLIDASLDTVMSFYVAFLIHVFRVRYVQKQYATRKRLNI
jgi:hypothetical protein